MGNVSNKKESLSLQILKEKKKNWIIAMILYVPPPPPKKQGIEVVNK